MKAITGAQLLAAVESETFIKGGTPSSAEGVKYDFRMGTRILKAAYGQPIDVNALPASERSALAIDPGEIVFVLTEERLELTREMIAMLSPKRKLSHQGIQVLGGLCIDPLYRGRLLVGLYNFSSTKWPLMPHKKLIAAVFYRLDSDEIDDFLPPESSVEDFPEDLVRLIQAYKPVPMQGLQDALAETQQQLADLRTEITSGREWQRQFQQSLTHHDNQIGEMITGLKAEIRAREQGEDKVTGAVNKMESTLSWLKGATWVVVVLVGFGVTAIAAPLVVPHIARLFGINP